MFYRQIIAHNGLPFELQLPNEKTIKAMKYARDGRGKKYHNVKAMFDDIDI